MDITILRIAVTVACFGTFLGIAGWACAGRNRDALRRSGAASPSTKTKTERAMSDFNANFWSLYVAGSPSSASSPACCCCGSRRARRSWPRRQHHRPRLGRGPGRNEQPDAALVDVAVRHHHRLRAAVPRGSTRAWAATRASSKWTTRGEYTDEVDKATQRARRRSMRSSPPARPRTLAGDPNAMAIGERLFMNNCAQCHGSDARGSKGFPNLADARLAVRRHAREDQGNHHRRPHGQMPPMAAAVGTPDDVQERRQLRAEPVRQPARFAARRSWARPSSRACAACHGADGKGNQALGAPNLTDDVWLHGWGEQAIVNMVNNGKINVMPAQQGKLTDSADPRPGRLRLGPVQQARASQALKESPSVRHLPQFAR